MAIPRLTTDDDREKSGSSQICESCICGPVDPHITSYV